LEAVAARRTVGARSGEVSHACGAVQQVSAA
jgi:hypothetical protein